MRIDKVILAVLFGSVPFGKGVVALATLIPFSIGALFDIETKMELIVKPRARETGKLRLVGVGMQLLAILILPLLFFLLILGTIWVVIRPADRD